MRDRKLPIGSEVGKCTTCGEYFTGDKSFQRHRITDKGGRRCLARAEMAAKGMIEVERKHGRYWAYGSTDRAMRGDTPQTSPEGSRGDRILDPVY